MTRASGWPLEQGERLIWAGCPDTRFRILWREWAFLGFSVLCGAFAGLLAGIALTVPAPPSLWLIIAALVLAVLAMLLGPAWYDQRQRRRTAYALTEHAALIRIGNRVAAYPITPESPLAPWRGGVRFGQKRVPSYRGSRIIAVGFEHLGDQIAPVTAQLMAMRARTKP